MPENPYADTTSYPSAGGYAGSTQYAGSYAGPPAHGGQQQWPLAGWGSRVGASLLDGLVACIGLIPALVGVILMAAGAPSGTQLDQATGQLTGAGGNGGLVGIGLLVMVLGYLLGFGITIWNRCFRQGRTGQSIGKKALGLYLLDERTGNPIGAGMAFVRELAHVLDGIFYIGYLWPLWDARKQTFADKVIGTVVAKAP